jgi:hypothetical protein
MKIINYTSEHRNDFSAKIQCEHCDHVQDLRYGYHDDNYHNRVLPAITCKACGKNRAGVAPQVANNDGTLHVSA